MNSELGLAILGGQGIENFSTGGFFSIHVAAALGAPCHRIDRLLNSLSFHGRIHSVVTKSCCPRRSRQLGMREASAVGSLATVSSTNPVPFPMHEVCPIDWLSCNLLKKFVPNCYQSKFFFSPRVLLDSKHLCPLLLHFAHNRTSWCSWKLAFQHFFFFLKQPNNTSEIWSHKWANGFFFAVVAHQKS